VTGKCGAGDYLLMSRKRESTGFELHYGSWHMNKNNRDWSAYQLVILGIAIAAAVFFSLYV
jgi:hypothetical protein